MTGRLLKYAVPALGLMLLAGCYQNGGGSTSQASLGAGSYRLSFALSAPPSGTEAINGVDLTLSIPEGVTIATLADGSESADRILDSALSMGSAVPGSRMITGRFSAAQHQARLSLMTATTTAWSGEFGQLIVTIPAGVSVRKSDFMLTSGSGATTYSAVTLTGPKPGPVQTVIETTITYVHP